MRTLIEFIVLLLLIFITASLLAVPLHALVQMAADVPFDKVITQSCSLTGLAFVFLYLRYLGVLNRQVAGFTVPHTELTVQLLRAFAAGIAIMLVLEGMLLLLGIHRFETVMDLAPATLSILFCKALLAGVLVGLLEETLYRGALFGGLQYRAGTLVAVLVTSVLYAAVHFIKFPQLPADTVIHWHTGLAILPDALKRFSDPAIIDHMLALLAFGVLLAMLRLKNGNIYQCIGLHAGVVFAIKWINHLTDYAPDNNYDFLVNQYDHLLGYLAFAWLVALIAAWHFLSAGRNR